ncbi:hypothetical protein RI129_003051 [Pyrocoelia pectoralis]|uniref:DDE Tnp4 domain-containing protein n=1 Tax=Pyrocoelia pectoralis TaxID=417401 RepID=A0AAN7VN93_9COLE
MECASSSSSSEWEEELETVSALIAGRYFSLNERKVSRRTWVHNINKKREQLGEFYKLVPELRKDPRRFHMYFRMSEEEFNFLHDLIRKAVVFGRHMITPKIKFFSKRILRFLATGNSFRSIAFSYRLGFSTVREIVKQVCEAIWKRLGPIAMPPPTEETWKKSAARFRELWHFPNCISAIDGKHINIQCPINAGSTYFNYKRCNSIVLMALVDADYKFISVDVGSYGRNSDGGIFSHSQMDNGEPQPYVVVGDEAFPLKTYMLRPYRRSHLGNNEPNKIFNYRLSRARRVVENAFGILVARWRCFRRYLEVQPDFVDKIVPEAALLNLDPIRRNNTREAFEVRENFKKYFTSEDGSVAWQLDIVRRGRIQV